jgi:peptidyl-prolyl cis-trans isomerase SurA
LDDDVLKKVMKYAKRKSPQEVVKKYNTADSTFISYYEHVYERGSRELAGYKFKKKSLSSVEKNERKGISTFKKISSIKPMTLKTMSEARGYIVADYQDYLERKWVSKLRNKYTVEINRDVLDQIIKK